MKILALAILFLGASNLAWPSAVNPSGQPYPNNTQFAFMATGGAQTIFNDFFLNRVVGVKYAWARKWYIRIPLETAEAFGFWYFVQAQTGNVPTPQNDRNRATCAAAGALVTASALSFDF